MSKEIAIVSETQGMMALLNKVVSDPNCDVDKMSKIIDCQERIFDKNAKIEYSKAMSECQREMPVVARDRTNDQTRSTYAAFESILNTVKPTYTKYGFALSFGTDQSPVEKHIRITCSVSHSSGHDENKFVDLPLDIAGIKGNNNKTGVHATGSTYSYGKRYLLTMIFNIAIANQDDDAVKSGGVNISDLMEHIAWVQDNFDAVATLKEALANEDWAAAYGVWGDFDEDNKRLLFRAPTKGGILTKDERAKMNNTPEWSQAGREYHKKPE